jgi:hypothetical protein
MELVSNLKDNDTEYLMITGLLNRASMLSYLGDTRYNNLTLPYPPISLNTSNTSNGAQYVVTNQLYGNGIYKVYYSSQFSSLFPAIGLFNKVLAESSAPLSLRNRWATGTASYNDTSNYSGSIKLSTNTVSGDWVAITLPYKIILSHYKLGSIVAQTGRVFTLYGGNSVNGNIPSVWTEIDSRVLSSSEENDGTLNGLNRTIWNTTLGFENPSNYVTYKSFFITKSIDIYDTFAIVIQQISGLKSGNDLGSWSEWELWGYY